MQILFAAASNSSAGASSVPKKVLLGCPRHDASSCHSHALFRGGGNIVASTTVKCRFWARIHAFCVRDLRRTSENIRLRGPHAGR